MRRRLRLTLYTVAAFWCGLTGLSVTAADHHSRLGAALAGASLALFVAALFELSGRGE